MATPERFDELSRGLVDGVARHPDLVGLALLGSASDQARDRRDEWSDHDFLAIVAPGRGQALRPDLGWLPDPDSLALTAREGEIGFVAVYDDGHVMEFAVAEASELSGAVAGDATVALDDESDTVTDLIDDARERATLADRFDPAQDARAPDNEGQLDNSLLHAFTPLRKPDSKRSGAYFQREYHGNGKIRKPARPSHPFRTSIRKSAA